MDVYHAYKKWVSNQLLLQHLIKLILLYLLALVALKYFLHWSDMLVLWVFGFKSNWEGILGGLLKMEMVCVLLGLTWVIGCYLKTLIMILNSQSLKFYCTSVFLILVFRGDGEMVSVVLECLKSNTLIHFDSVWCDWIKVTARAIVWPWLLGFWYFCCCFSALKLGWQNTLYRCCRNSISDFDQSLRRDLISKPDSGAQIGVRQHLSNNPIECQLFGLNLTFFLPPFYRWNLL